MLNSIPIRYGKVLICGASAADTSEFADERRVSVITHYISTEVLKPQEVAIAVKTVISSNDDEVDFLVC